jgi:hypothetical protein
LDSGFHKIAPQLALDFMPEFFRSFLICESFTLEDLAQIATYPDLLDHDNIRQNAEIHHAHSYKLDADGKWLTGDCLKTVDVLCAFALDVWRELQKLKSLPCAGQLAWVVRYALAKVTHYRIDALTYPHLHKGAPWSRHHAAFEAHMDKWIQKHRAEVGSFVFEPYSHVYKCCRQGAIESWGRGEELVQRIEAGDRFTDADCLMAARSCIQGVGDLWLTVSQQMGLC